jgi:hypothetical protein
VADQVRAGEVFEEEVSRRARNDTLGVQINDGVDQREAEKKFNQEAGLGEEDH